MRFIGFWEHIGSSGAWIEFELGSDRFACTGDDGEFYSGIMVEDAEIIIQVLKDQDNRIEKILNTK